MTRIVRSADIYAGNDIVALGSLLIGANGQVLNVACDDASHDPDNATIVDGRNQNLSPGWVDLQVNGFGDVLFEDCTSEEHISQIGEQLIALGTTRWFGALVSCPEDKLDRLLLLVQQCVGKHGLVGVHVEGPWLNEQYRGCHPSQRLLSSSKSHVNFVRALSLLCPVLVTAAPEIINEHDLNQLSELPNVKLFVGHSDVAALQAKGGSFDGVTHVLNGMAPFRARHPGALGWLLADPDRRASIICDGAHVTAETVALLKRALAPHQLFLVSDAMPADAAVAGQVSYLNDVSVFGKALQNPESVLAGSIGSIQDGLRFLVQKVGVPVSEALRMATRYPAGVFSLPFGDFAPGLMGDYVLFDNQFNVHEAWRAG